MNPEHIHLLYQYNSWANHRLLEASSTLPDQEFARNVGSSFPSVRDTLAHILAAEWVWLERWHGRWPNKLPPSLESLDLASLHARWAEVERELMGFVAGVSTHDLDQMIEYRNIRGNRFAYPLRSMLQHLVNHGSYHRGQVASMLRQLGVTPMATDMIVYYRQHSGKPPETPVSHGAIRALYDYNAWANHRVLDTCGGLTSEQLTRDLGASFRSVRGTLAHIREVEWLYLKRWKGTSPTALAPEEKYPDLASIRAGWAEIERDLQALVAGLTDDDVARTQHYRTTGGKPYSQPLWQMLQHLVNHSTYHRGQVTMLLRQLGAQPRATDFLRYFDVLAGQPEE